MGNLPHMGWLGSPGCEGSVTGEAVSGALDYVPDQAVLRAGLPFSDVNLRSLETRQPAWTLCSSLSEVSTLSLEFTYLQRAAGEETLPISFS